MAQFKRLSDNRLFDLLIAPPPPGPQPDEGPDNRLDSDNIELWDLPEGGRILVRGGICLLIWPGSRQRAVVPAGHHVAVEKLQPARRTKGGKIPEVLVLSKEEFERDFEHEALVSDAVPLSVRNQKRREEV